MPNNENTIGEVEGKLKVRLSLAFVFVFVFNGAVANSYEGLHSGGWVCEFVNCWESISNQLRRKVGYETASRFHKQLSGFMLLVEQGFLSSKVDSPPWSVLQNQSAQMRNITECPGKNKQTRIWKEMEQGKTSERKHTNTSYGGGGGGGAWLWERVG